MSAINLWIELKIELNWIENNTRPAPQWRSEGGICPRAPPGGWRQNPAKDFLKIYIRRNFKNSDRKNKNVVIFFFDYILDFSAPPPPPPPHKINNNIPI